jgi:hypothetical protein
LKKLHDYRQQQKQYNYSPLMSLSDRWCFSGFSDDDEEEKRPQDVNMKCEVDEQTSGDENTADAASSTSHSILKSSGRSSSS